MTSISIVTYLRFFLSQLPAAAVAIVAIVLLARGRQFPATPRLLGLAGFSLILGQTLLIPVSQTLVSNFLQNLPQTNSVGTANTIGTVYLIQTVFWSIFRGISYLCLLFALTSAFKHQSLKPAA